MLKDFRANYSCLSQYRTYYTHAQSILDLSSDIKFIAHTTQVMLTLGCHVLCSCILMKISVQNDTFSL